MEYVNFKIATNQPDLNRIYYHAKLDKLTICSEDENWKNAYGLTYKTYINCANNIYFLKLNETEHMMKCFKKTKDLNNPCQICGNSNYFEKSIFYENNTYIYCYENKDGYYFDDKSLEYKLCYTSCKKCNISGNDNEHNCIECKEGYNNEIYLSIYKNCLEKEIENKTELIQNMINNIFEQLNITDIDNGIDKKLNEKNISVIITSTKNQKKMKMKNDNNEFKSM